MRYLIVDLSTVLYRIRYKLQKKPDGRDLAKAECIQFVFQSVLKSVDEFSIDHVVVAFDSKSWRYAIYPEYKGNRKAKTKEDKIVKEDVASLRDTLYDYFNDETACSAVRVDGAEADDIIARWIKVNPHDDHLILSGDSDFQQLIAPNVSMFDPKEDVLTEHDGVFYRNSLRPAPGQRTVTRYGTTWKVKYVKEKGVMTDVEQQVDPAYALFFKVLKGDSGDNITPAIPKYYKKSKIRDAYEDTTGALLEELLDLPREDVGLTLTVRNVFDRNMKLISLEETPVSLCQLIDIEFGQQAVKAVPRMITAGFMKLCTRYELPRLSNRASAVATMLGKRQRMPVQSVA